MYTYKDLADLYKLCPHTLRRKLKNVLPLFKNFDKKKRKRVFNESELQIIFKILGKPINFKNIDNYFK
jgi:hypothetical protein